MSTNRMPRLVSWTPSEEARWLRQARKRRALPDYERPEPEAPDTAPRCTTRGCDKRVANEGERCGYHREQRAGQKRRARLQRRLDREAA